jgi:hypothetical protein
MRTVTLDAQRLAVDMSPVGSERVVDLLEAE